VSAGFAASPRRRRWREALLNAILWARAAHEEAYAESTLDPTKADELLEFSSQVQLCAAGCLEALGDDENYEFYTLGGECLRGGHGAEAVQAAISGGGCRRFLSTPVVHRFLMRKWRGYGIDLVRGPPLGAAPRPPRAPRRAPALPLQRRTRQAPVLTWRGNPCSRGRWRAPPHMAGGERVDQLD
jgi:hypothetical protein